MSTKLDDLCQTSKPSEQEGELQGMKFTLNRTTAEVDLLKKMLAAHKIDQMAEEVKKIKMLDFDMGTVK